MTNPKQTIEYLDELQKLGFTNEAFCLLHHFRENGIRETINSHRSYCEKTGSFDRDDGSNQRVQERLKIVLKYYRDYHAGNPAMFTQLADAAYRIVPAVGVARIVKP